MDLYSTRDIWKITGVSPCAISSRIRSGKLRGVKVGRQWRVRKSGLIDMVGDKSIDFSKASDRDRDFILIPKKLNSIDYKRLGEGRDGVLFQHLYIIMLEKSHYYKAGQRFLNRDDFCRSFDKITRVNNYYPSKSEKFIEKLKELELAKDTDGVIILIDIFTETQRQRHISGDYRKWRQIILERDNHRCTKCGSKDKLEMHHIKGWTDFPELRLKDSNVTTLREPCHTNIHRKERLK